MTRSAPEWAAVGVDPVVLDAVLAPVAPVLVVVAVTDAGVATVVATAPPKLLLQ